jgi:release factor glutamine methyltransferase
MYGPKDSYERNLTAYFGDHQKLLAEQYPGVTKQIFIDQWRQFCKWNLEHFTLDELTVQFLEKVSLGIPFQYIGGRSYFYRSSFAVNRDVLIPRPETELLVEMGKDFLNKKECQDGERFCVCDVGTGSGAIILSLLGELELPVNALAIDYSESALKVARKNAFNLAYTIHPETKLDFLVTDRLSGVTGEFDLIVSNPPYIKSNESRSKVHTQVDSFEPHMALYISDGDYDEWFECFFKQAYARLKTCGMFLMEGHEDFLEQQASELMKAGFKNVQVKKDLTGRNRFLSGVK